MTAHSPRTTALAGALCGLGSAALFGISAPLAKLLLPRVDAWGLAGLLVRAAGIALLIAGRSSELQQTTAQERR